MRINKIRDNNAKPNHIAKRWQYENKQCPCRGNADNTPECNDPRTSYAAMEQFYWKLMNEIRDALDHAVASSATLNKELILLIETFRHG